jgi:hypothetical protein
MRAFAQKQKQTRKPVSSILARSHLATLRPAHREHPVFHLQRAIGNQAVQQTLQTDTEEREAGLSGMASPRFGHDFSQIPVHPKSLASVQAKLAVRAPGDIYEDEAERVSDQVMNMSAPQLERTCACGGECPKCRTERPGQQHERLQTKHIGSSDFGQTAVPPIVHEVLRSPGQPLDPASRLFMEPRFGHDFSKLCVHTDEKAGESAQAIGAAAYTVGNDLVFGAGEFNPQDCDSRQLIAHELTHVLQQSKGSRNLQQQPKKGRVVRVERQGRSRRKPPGPGAYTEEELRDWYKFYPNAKTESVGMDNGKRTQDKAYTPEELWRRGYFYAITNVFGNLGTEVWLNNDGDGKVIGIDREIP